MVATLTVPTLHPDEIQDDCSLNEPYYQHIVARPCRGVIVRRKDGKDKARNQKRRKRPSR